MSDEELNKQVHDITRWLQPILTRHVKRPTDISEAGDDLDGILDSVRAITRDIELALRAEPSHDELETLMVELEVQIDHLQWHWKSLRKLLKGIV